MEPKNDTDPTLDSPDNPNTGNTRSKKKKQLLLLGAILAATSVTLYLQIDTQTSPNKTKTTTYPRPNTINPNLTANDLPQTLPVAPSLRQKLPPKTQTQTSTTQPNIEETPREEDAPYTQIEAGGVEEEKVTQTPLPQTKEDKTAKELVPNNQYKILRIAESQAEPGKIYVLVRNKTALEISKKREAKKILSNPKVTLTVKTKPVSKQSYKKFGAERQELQNNQKIETFLQVDEVLTME